MTAKRRPPKGKTNRRKLTTRQKLLADGVAQGKTGTQAAIAAGYSPKTARVQAAQTLAKLNVQARVERRLAELRVTKEEVIATLASQMRSDLIEDLFKKDGTIDLEEIQMRGLGHLIKKFKIKRELEGEGDDKRPVEVIEVEAYSAQAAAVQLCKVLGMERSVEQHQPVNVSISIVAAEGFRLAQQLGLELSPEELAQELAAIDPEVARQLAAGA